jgi:hypothetical protein
MRAAFVVAVLSLAVASQAAIAQGVTIPNVTPSQVVEALKAELIPQGFAFARANDKNAVFTLDRGMVQQQANNMTRGSLVHIVLEFTVRFKQKEEGLQVLASEELVGNPERGTQFRRPIDSLNERNNMQQLLDGVRARLLAAADSTAKRDTTP